MQEGPPRGHIDRSRKKVKTLGRHRIGDDYLSLKFIRRHNLETWPWIRQ
jgi:hypothetical protein